jgi:membrane-bound serine protease (ClpP class)
VLLLSLVLGFAMRARQRPAATGSEEMIGLEGDVVSWEGTKGAVRVHGEVWSARGTETVKSGGRVRVVSRDGLTLNVEAI